MDRYLIMPRNQEMPNLFVIGAQKCGTSSLHRYLDLHPEISMSKLKEPRYFSSQSRELGLESISDRQCYLDLFDYGTQVRGESSPEYSVFPKVTGVAARIAAEVPDAKFIYLVRDPVERIRSQIVLRSSLGLMPPPPTGQVIRDLPVDNMIWRSCYMTQLDQYLEHFSRDSIYVVDSRDLMEDRYTTLRGIFDFVGVNPDFRHHDFFRITNASSSFKAPPASWLGLREMPFFAGLRRDLPRSMRRFARRLVSEGLGTEVPKPEIADSLCLELEEVFRPEVCRLREFTGLPFDHWSV